MAAGLAVVLAGANFCVMAQGRDRGGIALSADADASMASTATGAGLVEAGRIEAAKERTELPEEPRSAGLGFGAAGLAAEGAAAADRSELPRTVAAPVYNRYIEPDETAQKLTPFQSAFFGVRQSISPYFLLTIAAAAGYEQAVNGAPNYGTNFTAYGKRVGAAAIRDTSQSVLSDSVMSPLLHEDPRYYILGDHRRAFIRATYALSRIVVGRTDGSGGDGKEHATPNYGLVAGYAEAAALTNAYYPDENVGFSRTARSFVGSLAGAAASNLVREFLPDILRAARLPRFD